MSICVPFAVSYCAFTRIIGLAGRIYRHRDHPFCTDIIVDVSQMPLAMHASASRHTTCKAV